MAGQMTERPFQLGVIASPHPHGPQHMRTLEVVPQIEALHLCGIAGEDPKTLGAGSAKVRSITDNPADVLGNPEIDALVVCVRNDLCPALLEAAIAAGKPVIFEKPGALYAADLRCIAARAHERGVVMGTFFLWRGQPIIQEVKQALNGGAFGRIMTVEARMVTSQVRYRDPSHWLFRRETAGSGILSWLACHYLDALSYLLDDRVSEVVALTGQQNPERIEVEDTACVALRYRSGVMGTLNAGYHLRGSVYGYAGATYDTFIALRGTDGYVRMPFSDGPSYMLYSEAPGWAAGGRRERRVEPPASPAYGGKPGEAFLLDFLRAAREGRQPLAPIDAAVHILEIAEAALESAASGRLVHVGTTS